MLPNSFNHKSFYNSTLKTKQPSKMHKYIFWSHKCQVCNSIKC